MAGDTNLEKLLQSMSPSLAPQEYVFVSIAGAGYGEHADLAPVGAFSEAEGLTLVIPKLNADQRALSYQSVFKCISLQVHSSLDAIGLTAAFSNALADSGISTNVIAAYYHDHIFVQTEHADRALSVLKALSQQAIASERD